MTYSILALDLSERRMGVATASGSVAVGSRVPWAKRGVGIVATQAYTNPSLGPYILGLLERGADPSRALYAALLSDPRPELRQVAVMDTKGRYAVHHGSVTPSWRGHVVGRREKVLCVANLVVGPQVCEEAIRAFEESKGDFVSRIMSALAAAHRVGGDARGDRSAALIVVNVDPAPYPDSELKVLDLRVDFSADPINELFNLLKLIRRVP